ncbi:MAG: hypothetical protein QNJ94_13105 [Alphaproteobacteria bacterium]|nr:hypothetical protein [Alphaproteobacteria bacterium]
MNAETGAQADEDIVWQEQAAPQKDVFKESDMDSLHILPLSVIPLETSALAKAKMIKNIRLESVIELFNEAKTGSGQLRIDELDREYGWPLDRPHADRTIIRKLASLPSYDVFSLRIALREQNIPLQDNAQLQLSEGKRQELAEYMRSFTRPLIQEIYGSENLAAANADDLIALFRDPDVKRARERLELMANKLEIEVDGVPKFLEDYGDIFLSFSYYRQCLDRVTPLISDLVDSLDIIRNNWQLRHETRLLRVCDDVERRINDSLVHITGRFESFDKSSQEMWDNLSAERFRKVEKLIKSYHTTIGGVLCALTIKMRAWKRMFPEKSNIGPVKFAEFIMGELKQGLEKVEQIDAAAPMLSQLD